jgi:hypothetical protein
MKAINIAFDVLVGAKYATPGFVASQREVWHFSRSSVAVAQS